MKKKKDKPKLKYYKLMNTKFIYPFNNIEHKIKQ